jgi:acylphosphatase
VSKNGGEVSYYATMEQGAEGMDLSGIVYRDENGIAQVATLNEDSSTWRAEDIVNVNTMKTYVEDVTEDIADDILESEEFNTKVINAVNNLDIEISADPLWVNIN